MCAWCQNNTEFHKWQIEILDFIKKYFEKKLDSTAYIFTRNAATS